MQSATASDPGRVNAEYEALKRDLEAELAPATPTERTFAGIVVHATWRIQCCDRIESRLDLSDPEAGERQAAFDRTRAQATNNLRKALRELRLLQTERRLRVELFQGAAVTAGHGLVSYKEIVSTLAKDAYRRAAATNRNPTLEDFQQLLNKTNPTVSQEPTGRGARCQTDREHRHSPTPQRGRAPVSQESAGTKPEIAKRTQPPAKTAPPPGRNAPCPCHSGHKFKRCCGRNAPVPFPPPKAQAA